MRCPALMQNGIQGNRTMGGWKNSTPSRKAKLSTNAVKAPPEHQDTINAKIKKRMQIYKK